MPVLANPKHEIVAQEIATGKTATEALKTAGYAPKWAEQNSPKITRQDEVKARIAELQSLMVDSKLADAREIHEYLTECFRADMRDIRNEDGGYKPQSQWPAIWGRMMEAGDCEVEKTYERSSDGVQAGKSKAWDENGTITKIKLRFSRRSDIVKMLGQHKAVDAFVAQKQDVNININIQGIAQRLAEGRRRMLAAEIVSDEPIAE